MTGFRSSDEQDRLAPRLSIAKVFGKRTFLAGRSSCGALQDAVLVSSLPTWGSGFSIRILNPYAPQDAEHGTLEACAPLAEVGMSIFQDYPWERSNAALCSAGRGARQAGGLRSPGAGRSGT